MEVASILETAFSVRLFIPLEDSDLVLGILGQKVGLSQSNDPSTYYYDFLVFLVLQLVPLHPLVSVL